MAEELDVTVKGLVCFFCARGGKKTFAAGCDRDKSRSGKKLVVLLLKEGSPLSNIEIESFVTDTGYSVTKIEGFSEAEKPATLTSEKK